jgi:N-acetylneuraminic acid mutarotase
VVTFGDSFLLIGGRTSPYVTYLSTIYHYNPDEDSWTLLDAKMKQEKCSVIAKLVGREVL